MSTTAERLEATIEREWFNAKGAENMTDAILREFVVIPRADLPEVIEDQSALCIEHYSYLKNNPSTIPRKTALRNIAYSLHLEAEEAGREAREAEEKRNTRRDELAATIEQEAYGVGRVIDYTSMTKALQVAIDRIIDAEEAQDTP